MEALNQGVALSWTPSAVYCEDTNQHCGNCINFDIVGTSCSMLEVIRILKAKGVQPAAKPTRESCHAMVSIKETENAWLAGRLTATA